MKNELEQKLLICMFLTCIFSVSLLTILNFSRKEIPEENRLAANFPALNQEMTACEVPQAVQAFFDDRLAFRLTLVKMRNILKLSLFGVSPVPSVITGLNRWLFYSDYLELEEQGISAKDIGAWLDCVHSRKQKAESNGAKYIFVIVPDKSIIYREHLPHWLKRNPDLLRSDLIAKRIAERANSDIVYLRDALEKAKKGPELFLHFDTHWNSLGAFVGSQETLRKLASKTNGITGLRRDDFDLKWTCYKNTVPDLSKMIGTGMFLQEKIPILLPRDQSLTMRDFDASGDRSKIFRFKTKNTLAPKILLVGDSFARTMLPFLTSKASEIVFSYDRDFLEHNSLNFCPDIVIDETLAVSLAKVAPASWTCLSESERGQTLFKITQLKSPDQIEKLVGCALNSRTGTIEASSVDPQIILPRFNMNCTKRKILALNMVSPEDDDVDVFYQTNISSTYESNQYIRRSTKQGSNQLHFELPTQATGEIRIDPGTKIGTYKIKSIEVFESK